jgi:hypothetical protein
MGEVVVLDAWRNGDKVVISTACPRPFHHEEYVVEDHCLGCNIPVTLAESVEPGAGQDWYG